MITKTVSVDVDVNVDLDLFDTEDLCRELIGRLNAVGRRRLTTKQKTEIIEELQEINEEFGLNGIAGISIKTLEDKMKVDHLIKVWNKYPPHQLEKMLPQ